MHILMTGATGFIGADLAARWRAAGHKVTAWVRSSTRAKTQLGGEVTLVETLEEIAPDTHIDAVVNLAGAPIAARPWTKSRRKELLDSRIHTTNALIGLLERLKAKPTVMISASAAGYYGRRGEEWLTEDASPQDIFMSNLCADWEAAAAPAAAMGIRLVIPRISVVLGPDGGAFPSLARPIRFGLGAKLGDGKHYFPWIHKADLLAAFDHILENKALSGPVNLVAPDAKTQADFNQTLADTLKRPNFMWVPGWVLKTALGEMSDLFLAGQRMSADKLTGSGFQFTYPTLKDAAKDLLS